MLPPLTVNRAVLLGGSLLALSVFLKHTMGSRQPAALEGRICGWLEGDLNTSDYSLCLLVVVVVAGEEGWLGCRRET